MRIYGCHDDDPRGETGRALELAERERAAGLDRLDAYRSFAQGVVEDKLDILSFLIARKREGLRIAGYGAPAKGNTMLNYCGIGPELVEFTCDLNPHKQGHLLPGSHIPIHSPEVLKRERPDIVLILPWNLREEIVEQLAFIREWGGRFVARAPELRLLA